MTSAQTSPSPAISTSINTTNAANTTTAGSSKDTRKPPMQNICQLAQSNGIRQSSSSTNEISNNTANAGGSGAASSSNRTMQGRPNPNNTKSNTSNNNNNITTPSGQNVSAISRSIGQARTDLVEACNAVNNGDSSSTLVHLNLVARALDNIEGNLSSNMATGGGEGITTNVPPTGGTSASSVEGATAGEKSGS